MYELLDNERFVLMSTLSLRWIISIDLLKIY